MPVKRWPFEVAALTIAGLMLAYMLSVLVQSENMTVPNGQPLFGDFTAFWSAGRATLDGDVAGVHERAVTFPIQQSVAPDALYYAPWNSPPTFLFVACLLALMPYPVAALSFLGASTALYITAARKLLPDARALIFAATAPAAIYHAGTVQAGLLIAGVTGLALHWLDTRPRVSGALVALLAIKPHIAIVWPIFLALSGRWRVFWSAAICVTIFAGASGFVFGFDAYVRFVENLADSARLISGQRITTPAYASLYANLLSLKIPNAVAMAAHTASALAGLVVAALVFLKRDRITGGAALCAATLLLSPYLFFYDFLILAAGAALLGAPRDRLELLAAILAWGAGLTVAVGAYIALPICPLAAWLILLVAARRAEIWGPRLAPAQPM